MLVIVLSAVIYLIYNFTTTGTTEDPKNDFYITVNMTEHILAALLWISYVYLQEFDKKSQFISGHRRVRNFLKLKSVLGILVPSLVRDRIRSG